MMRLALYMLLCYLSALNTLFAQQSIAYLGIDQGLSNDYVTDIYQDHKGFMWFGTSNGLNRYDGYAYKVYKNIPLDKTSLPDNRITDVLEDSQGHLFVATKVGAAVLHADQETFSRFLYRSGSGKLDSIAFSIHQLETDCNKRLFAGSGDAGLLAIEKTKEGYIATSVPLLLAGQGSNSAYNVSGMGKTPDGTLWLLVHNVGVCYYDPNLNRVIVHTAGNYNASTVACSQDGDIWFSTNWGITRYRPATKQFTYYTAANGLSSKRIVHLHYGKDHKIWACSDGDGIQKIDIATGAIANANDFDVEQLTSKSVFTVYEDAQQRQWIGTWRGGINLIDPNKGKFELIRKPATGQQIRAENFVLALEESSDSNLWIGTDGAGLLKWDKRQKQYMDYAIGDKTALQQAFVTDLQQGPGQQLWIATYDRGIFRLDEKTGTLRSYDCIYPHTTYFNKAIWRIFEDSSKRLWVATLNGGQVYVLDRQHDKFQPLELPIYDVLSFFEDDTDRLWMGSWSDLTRLDVRTRQYTKFPIGTPVRFMLQADKHHLWLGTEGGGLLHFNIQSGQFKRYTEKDGLPSNSLLNALKDQQGNLWISTYNGLCKFDPQRLHFQNFYKSDGLQSNQFNYNAALLLKSGEMAFGGIRGLNIFQPKSTQIPVKFPPLMLTQFQIDNTPYSAYDAYADSSLASLSSMVIPYDKAVLSFSFAALEYSFPEKIKYAYFLEGWDKDWNYVEKQRAAHYSHLKEGNYTLRIKSTDANGVWNSKEHIMSIRILPPWWRSNGAYALYVLLLVGAFYLYSRYIKNKQSLLYQLRSSEFERDKEHELHEKKITFFTHIAHEFRTPLTLIVNPIKEMLYPEKEEAVDTSAELQHVYTHAKRLLSLVDKLLLFRKADSDFDELRFVKLDIVALTREVFYCFQQLAHARQIDYQFQGSVATHLLYADREKLEICLFNLLQNALKFTENSGKVQVYVQADAQQVSIHVRDSGNGVSAPLSDQIFQPFHRDYARKGRSKEGFGIGLFLVRKFALAHEGQVDFQQNDMGGQTFTLTLPCQPAQLKDKLIFEDLSEQSLFIQELLEEEPQPPAKTGIYQDEKSAKIVEMASERPVMLLVDDNVDIRQYICKIFEQEFDILQADSGEKALEILQKTEPDIVISDVVMKDVSGIDLCEKIKTNIHLSQVPVILLTASFSADVKLKGIEGGADDYITKPFDKDILQARVHNLIQNRQRLHQYFHSEITLQANDYKIPAEYKEFLQQAIQAVELNLLDSDFTVGSLAESLGMSHSNLYRRIKSISGKSANEFIRYIRLRKVAQLLVDTKANINEAAFKAGFNDIKHFRQQFSKLFGCTPSAYRKRYAHLKNKYRVEKE
ncbi:hybrid sensor histidine kinase/response regulator transcription factor [Sphingobacterium griseoflavum]|uniref:histidine kinase n=1 Tax=Sphingobacterium griseoflavum TaxID=1474952 RepID=A0ABQ3HSS1_9SPHI|nr:two-component regulator propeller domain-containing protein [Sphingobacterium griseoflavum]GHE30225.1 hybrid sensor histidine kinase/response regulator [Sphingobacterium griseoflavum]